MNQETIEEEVRCDTGRPPGVFDEAFLTGVEGVSELLLIRHAQQEVDPDGVAADWVDPLLAEALCTKRFDALFASPLRRAAETAEPLAAMLRLPVETVPDLREVEVFRDVPPDQRVSDFLGEDLLKGVRERMLNERCWDVYPASERSYDFKKRAINAIEMIIAKNVGERVLVVCHGAVINAFIGHIVGTPYDMFFRPAHASVNIVAVGRGRRVLRLLNDTHHLTTAEGEFATY